MGSSVRYAIALIGTAAIMMVAYFYFLAQPKKIILGQTLVLAFVTDVGNAAEIAKQWAALDLDVELLNTCHRKQQAKNISCVTKHINKAVSRTQKINKSLVVLADRQQIATVLSALNQNYGSDIAAVVLLRPQVELKLVDNLKLPKTIVISEASDDAKSAALARQFASRVRNNDQWAWSTMLVQSDNTLISHPVLPHIISYSVGGRVDKYYQIEFNAESRWQQPTVNNDAFFQFDKLIETRVVDNDIRRILKAFYAFDPNLLKQWPGKSYQALNILKYRDQLPVEQQGRYVSFRNRKGHQFYLDLQRYGRFQPEFVIALDDEDNLYRLTTFYKTKQYYSWKQGGPSNEMLYSQSLGAFIHFQKPPPAHYELPYLQYSSIIFKTIKFSDQDPYSELNNLSYPAFHVLTSNCIPCHSVNKVGGAAHHLDYLTGQPQPGFAKPLLAYPKEVLQNFFFNQTATAQLIGVNPNYVDQKIGEEIINWLQPN